MTPTETAAKLQHFNDWRRGHHDDTAHFDPREIGEAIDAAIAMIDRLEVTEGDIILKEKIIESLGSTLNAVAKERDDLLARIEAMERQEPVAWVRKLGLDLPSVGCVTDLKYRPSDIPESSYIPLYLAPGAKGE